MTSFKVGDEVYIKGMVGGISEKSNYGMQVDIGSSNSTIMCTNDGKYYKQDRERSLFHASEIQLPNREYKIGQKLNGFAEVMRALINEQFVHVAGSIYRLDEFDILYWKHNEWDKTSRSIDAFTSGIIVEDPTPKKMVAWDNNGHILILPPDVDVHSAYKKITKQELAAILECVE